MRGKRADGVRWGMRTYWLVLLSLACVGTAQADAVGPPRVHCPHGTTAQASHSGGTCVPRSCSMAHPERCGEGATCRAFGECLAMRVLGGRVGPTPREVRVGICGPGDHCDEGRCSHVTQCEPTAHVRGWDRATHQWTGL
jgi:hypothetical protein